MKKSTQFDRPLTQIAVVLALLGSTSALADRYNIVCSSDDSRAVPYLRSAQMIIADYHAGRAVPFFGTLDVVSAPQASTSYDGAGFSFKLTPVSLASTRHSITASWSRGPGKPSATIQISQKSASFSSSGEYVGRAVLDGRVFTGVGCQVAHIGQE